MTYDSKILSRVAGPVLAIVAFAVYLSTMSTGAFPGESENLLVETTEIFPKLSPSFPLWTFFAWIVTQITGRYAVFCLNFLSVLFGSVSVLLFFRIVSSAVARIVEDLPGTDKRGETASLLAGVVAALALMFCKPFWIVSTRAHTMSFNVLLLLAMTLWFMRLTARGRSRTMLFFAFLYGVLTVEYAGFIPFLFLFAPYLLFVLWCREELDGRISLELTLCGVLGLLFYFVAAAFFYGGDGYLLRDFGSFFRVVWEIWRQQYIVLTRSLPQFGWLTVLFLTVAPWLACLFLSRRALSNDRDIMLHAVHLVITGIAVCVFLDIDFIAEIFESSRQAIVIPHLLLSSVMGYLAAYWYLLPSEWWWESEDDRLKALRGVLGRLLPLPLVAVVCIAPLMNHADASGRYGRIINRYAKEVVKSMGEREWLIGDGRIDYQVMLAARAMGRTVHTASLPFSRNASYMKYISSLMDSQRLKNMADLGMLPLLKEWIRTDPAFCDKVAVYSDTDLWQASRYTMLPDKLVFLGVENIANIDAGKITAEHEAFWAEMLSLIGDEDKNEDAQFRFGALKLHMSKVANNLGILFEDMERYEEAYRMYAKARHLYRDNVSALLNIKAMQNEKRCRIDAEGIDEDMQRLAASIDMMPALWSLYNTYGYVRSPHMFAQMGWVWAISGQADLAVRGLKKAIDLVPDKEKPVFKIAAADIFMSRGREQESKALLLGLLKENPQDPRTLLGLARISAREKDPDIALEYIERAEQAGAEEFLVDLEKAALFAGIGENRKARVILERIVSYHPESLRACSLLAELALRQNDEVSFRKYIHILEKLPGGGLISGVLQGDYALGRNELADARQHYEKLMAVGGKNNVSLIAKLLQIDVLELKFAQAKARLSRLLSIDPSHHFGNHVLGLVNAREKKYDLAEDSFRKSLASYRDPLVLNDLAWTLCIQDQNIEEAEALAREALESNPRLHVAWDTLGVVQMKKGKLDEAERSFNRSLQIYKGGLTVYMNLADLQIRKGNKKAAREILNMVFKQMNLLQPEEQARLVELRKQSR